MTIHITDDKNLHRFNSTQKDHILSQTWMTTKTWTIQYKQGQWTLITYERFVDFFRLLFFFPSNTWFPCLFFNYQNLLFFCMILLFNVYFNDQMSKYLIYEISSLCKQSVSDHFIYCTRIRLIYFCTILMLDILSPFRVFSLSLPFIAGAVA